MYGGGWAEMKAVLQYRMLGIRHQIAVQYPYQLDNDTLHRTASQLLPAHNIGSQQTH